MLKIEFDQKCVLCKGTGLYQGMGEKKEFAVQCCACKGTGKYHFIHEYEKFTGRKNKQGIKRVLQYNPGICIKIMPGDTHLDTFGGMSYKDWKKGKLFTIGMEMRKYTCPAWWYQFTDLKVSWNKCINLGSFNKCNNFKDKVNCWKRWDKEYTKNGEIIKKK